MDAPLHEVEVPEAPVTGLAVYVSDRMVELIRELGYKYVPLTTGASFRGLQDSIVNYGANHDPKLITCLHEEIAVSLAHGYAKATGQPAIAAVHTLVGLMHASMAVFDAWADGVPIVILGGSGPALPRERRSLDWTHSANSQSDIVKQYVKWTAEPIDESGTLESIRQAHRFARSGLPGPTYVTIDAEVQERPVELNPRPIPRSAPAPALTANVDEIERAARLLVDAEFPLVTSGRAGLRQAITPPLVRLVEALGAAYRDDQNFASFPTDHPLNCSADRRIADEADVIVAVDVVDPGIVMNIYSESARVGDGQTTRRTPKLIDITMSSLSPSSWSYFNNAAIEREAELVADPVVGLEQLLAAVEGLLADEDTTRRDERATRRVAVTTRREQALERERQRREAEWDSSPISAARMVDSLWRAVEGLPWILALRNTRSWPEGIWKFSGGGEYMGHSGGAGVGYGPGAMVGVALAAHDRGQIPVAIIGDGDLVMAASALWTAVHYRLPLLVVVNNNSSFYNDEVHQDSLAHMRGRNPANAWVGTRVQDPNVDFANVARSYGGVGMGPIEDPNDLDGAMEWAVKEVQAGRVALVDVRVKRDRTE